MSSYLLLFLVRVKVFGGEGGPASIIAPKMGKLKINAKLVQADIQKKTAPWKGIRVVVIISVINRQYTITIENCASSLLLRELGPEYYNRKRKQPTLEKHHGNLTLD